MIAVYFVLFWGYFCKLVSISCLYWKALFILIFLGKDYDNDQLNVLLGDNKWAKVHIFSLSIIFTKLWSKQHYRSSSFQQDMIDNLRNVAIPGTGIPLSVFCYSYYVCLFFILFLNPLTCYFAAVNKARKYNALSGKSIFSSEENFKAFLNELLKSYELHLLTPDDWFSFWRLNCRHFIF